MTDLAIPEIPTFPHSCQDEYSALTAECDVSCYPPLRACHHERVIDVSCYHGDTVTSDGDAVTVASATVTFSNRGVYRDVDLVRYDAGPWFLLRTHQF